MIDHPGFSGYSTLEAEEYQSLFYPFAAWTSVLITAGLFAPLSSRTLTETSDFIVSLAIPFFTAHVHHSLLCWLLFSPDA